jgi:hypothetical protein
MRKSLLDSGDTKGALPKPSIKTTTQEQLEGSPVVAQSIFLMHLLKIQSEFRKVKLFTNFYFNGYEEPITSPAPTFVHHPKANLGTFFAMLAKLAKAFAFGVPPISHV